MTTIASAGATPLAFTLPPAASAEGAAKAAAGFGSVPLQRIQEIDSQVQKLLADAAGERHGTSTEAEAPHANAPALRKADMPRMSVQQCSRPAPAAPRRRP